MSDHGSEIDGLIDEHRELMSIMGELRRAVGQTGSDVDGLFDKLGTAFAHHTEREEVGLFHALHEVAIPDEYMGMFEHDHGHLVDLINSARRDRHSVAFLQESLQAHMVREENDMFPAAEQLLGAADWDAIDAAVAHLR